MKSSLFMLSVLLCTGLFAQNGNSNLSRWHNNDKTDVSDYQSVKKSGLYFYISNDNDNVYIDLKFENREAQGMILKQGMIIWINMDGKPGKILGVKYPAGSQKQLIRNNKVQSDSDADKVGNPEALLSMANTIELIGFISEQERRFSSQNADNFRGSVRYDGGVLYYNMVMPIAKLPVRNTKEGKGAMPFTLGIEYGFPPDINKIDGKTIAGRNTRNQQTAAGSELHWIKNVKLATNF